MVSRITDTTGHENPLIQHDFIYKSDDENFTPDLKIANKHDYFGSDEGSCDELFMCIEDCSCVGGGSIAVISK